MTPDGWVPSRFALVVSAQRFGFWLFGSPVVPNAF
jgi:hypothetical protein